MVECGLGEGGVGWGRVGETGGGGSVVVDYYNKAVRETIVQMVNRFGLPCSAGLLF